MPDSQNALLFAQGPGTSHQCSAVSCLIPVTIFHSFPDQPGNPLDEVEGAGKDEHPA